MRQITRLFLTCQLTLALIGWSGQRTGADAADTIEGTVPRPPARLIVQPSVRRPDSVIFALSGKIEAPLARQIEEAFEQHKDHVRRIVLKLNSGGGSVRAGRKAIEVLQRIKKTHQLDTVVEAGRQCGSMCVFLYAQGQQRYAAAASLWLFHEVSCRIPATGRVNKLDRDKWLSLIDSIRACRGLFRMDRRLEAARFRK